MSGVLTRRCMTEIIPKDLRDISKSIMWIRHPGPVRAVVFSPITSHPLQAICGLDNGAIYRYGLTVPIIRENLNKVAHRWDLNKGQRGQLDRVLAAHGGPILSLDWTVSTGSGASVRSPQSNWYGASGSALGLLDDIIPSGPLQSSISSGGGDTDGTGIGWLASGGLDGCVKASSAPPCVILSRHSHKL